MPQVGSEVLSIDVALARREFLLAMSRCSEAIGHLYDVSLNGRNRDRDSAEIATEWVRLWNVNVPWILDWARGAILGLLVDASADDLARATVEGIARSWSSSQASIKMNPGARWGQWPSDTPRNRARLTMVVLQQYWIPPLIVAGWEDERELFDFVTRWQPCESPPDGGLSESKKEFLGRMERAFDKRRAALQERNCLPTKRALRQHAEWTVRYHIAGESVASIASTHNTPQSRREQAKGVPTRTVEKALKEFAALVGLRFPATSPPADPKANLG